jgi:membrane protease YdiL (CAAX protease family)
MMPMLDFHNRIFLICYVVVLVIGAGVFVRIADKKLKKATWKDRDQCHTHEAWAAMAIYWALILLLMFDRDSWTGKGWIAIFPFIFWGGVLEFARSARRKRDLAISATST